MKKTLLTFLLYIFAFAIVVIGSILINKYLSDLFYYIYLAFVFVLGLIIDEIIEDIVDNLLN